VPTAAGDVHGAGIIREQHAAKFQGGAQFTEGGGTGEIGARGESFWRAGGLLDASGDARGHFFLGGEAEDEPAAAGAFLDFNGGMNEALLRPAFGGAVFRAGMRPNQSGVSWNRRSI